MCRFGILLFSLSLPAFSPNFVRKALVICSATGYYTYKIMKFDSMASEKRFLCKIACYHCLTSKERS